MEKKSSKKTIVVIAAVTLVLAALFVFAALYVSNKMQKDELADELTASETELYIRRFASDARLELARNEEEKYEEELALRKQLKEEMLERDASDLLALVNPWNEINSDYKARIVKIGIRGKDEDMFFDERGAYALVNMLSDCEAAGCRPVAISAYRTFEYQSDLYENKVQREIWSGVSPEQAPEKAAESVARPGTSEHELGLAVDIIDDNNQNLDITQEWTDTQRWLMQHCTDYGFILRYPNGTTETTGIIYEPWHYRYVGAENAKDYTESEYYTLEEYLEK